jgi:chromosome segregation ATPase
MEDVAKSLRKKLVKSEVENAKLKETVAKQDEDFLTLGKHSSEMECEASKASKARDRAEASLAKLFEEFKSLQAKHAELQKDHSILKEDLGQLEEKHSETLEQLEASQTLVIKAEKRKVVAEEKYQHFQGKYKKRLQLKEAKAKAANYLRQLSFTSMIKDSTWADRLHLGFETFKAWLKDPTRKINLDMVHIEDIPCTKQYHPTVDEYRPRRDAQCSEDRQV